jgi:DNA-binding NtrC family response regulator
LRERIASAARSQSTVLVRGESGSGKELVAAALHRLSPRHKGPFIKVNCAAIAASLVEDELFGHERGAFTDAREAKSGLFEAANGGTLLLDEIGDMEPALQARLLRVLEDGRVRRLGGTREIAVDVRVVASTHRDLQAAVRDGRFRGDLFYRLACLEIEVPPLRERPADVPLLAVHFVALVCRQNRMRPKGIEAEALRGLERHAWPGNVRELRHACERAVIFGGDPVRLVDFSVSGDQPEVEASRMLSLDGAPALTLREFRSRCEREYILHVMKQEAWALASAAQRLGLKRTYLYAKLSALGILRPG